MKYISKLSVRIAVAIAVGFLLAVLGTKLTYSCTTIDGAMGCVSFEKAVMHPGDLLANKQNSLVTFSITFAITSLIALALLSVTSSTQKPKERA